MTRWGTRDPSIERALVAHLLHGERANADVAQRLAEERLEDFHQASPRSRARAALFALATDEIHAQMREQPFVFVKGAVVDPWLFGAEGRRGSSDIDLLVSDAARAHRSLEALGYRRRYSGSHARLEALKHERAYVHETLPTVDLHTALLATDAFVDLTRAQLSRRVLVETPNGALPALDVHDMLVHYAGNLASSRATGLVHALVDVRAIEQKCRVDWSVVERRARLARCTTGLFVLLRASEVLFGRSFAHDVQSRVAPRGPRRAWIDRLLGFAGAPFTTREPFGILLFDWPLSDSRALPARRALRVLRSRLAA